MRARLGLGGAIWTALSFVQLVPVWSGRTLPILDYPNHLALVRIWDKLEDPAYGFAAHFAARVRPVPYLLYYGVLRALGHVVSLENAHKVVLSVYLVAFPLAVLSLARALGRSPWLAFGAFALAYCPSVLYGYEAYMLAATCFFFGLAALVRWMDHRRTRDVFAFGAAATLAYLLHLVPWAFLMAITALAAWRALVAFAPSIALAAATAISERLDHAYLHDPGEAFRGTWRTPVTALAELPRWTLDLFPGSLDMGLLAVVALTVVALALRGARPRKVHAIAIALVACAYFSLPFEMSTPVVFYMISARVPLLLGPLLLLLPSAPLERRARAFALPLIAVAAIVPLCLAPRWRDFSARSEPFFRLVDQIPLGKTTFVARRALMPTPLPAEKSGDSATCGPAYWAEGAWPVALRGGYSPYLFDQGIPVVYTTRLAAPPFPPRDDFAPREAPEFDYYLLREAGAEAKSDPALALVAREGPWELYRRLR
jgi:hypothetical protein